MTQLLKCRIRQHQILIPTELIHYVQRAMQWRQLPHALPPIVGIVQSRNGWIPVLDLAYLFDGVETTPRASTRLVVSSESNGSPYAILCEQVMEITKGPSNPNPGPQELFELDGELCRVWNPSSIDTSHYKSQNLRGIQ